MRDNINLLFNNYLQIFPEEAHLFEVLGEQIDDNEDIISRKNFLGHVTASGLLILDNKQILAIFHKSLQKYLQPGGHIEPQDHYLSDSAQREIAEETGISDVFLHDWCKVHQAPILIDTHIIPANPKKDELAHYHHDFMFIFHTSQKSTIIDKSEITGFQWIDIVEARQNDSNIAKALDKMSRLGLIL